MRKNTLSILLVVLMSMAAGVVFTSCGDDEIKPGGGKGKTPSGVKAVDLGLPSGTLWANMNVGANKPEDYGDYFAWGETTGYNGGKTNFGWRTYIYCIDYYANLTKYCNNSGYGYNGFTDNKTELEPEDDAAYTNWGKKWRMPSKAQIDELHSYCTWEFVTLNGINGCMFISKSNGNSIFLPAAGYRDVSLIDAGYCGNYWSRTLGNDGQSVSAHELYFKGDVYTTADGREVGFSVRPVHASE